ncbi:MAG TPA: adenylosuccinate lyase [Flavobacteriales bacterium]|jgi:adenylosuccinate lyase|nr:adenylosuccinate lyase [Flavobacteriales bacterium]
MIQEGLSSIAPVDGRYRDKTLELIPYFSEWALFKYRIQIEVEYFIALCELPLPQLVDFDISNFSELRNLYADFSLEDAEQIKHFERTTNHDVKAVEYFIKEKMTEMGLSKWKEFVHFGLTSQDINNSAIPLLLKEATLDILVPCLKDFMDLLKNQAVEWDDITMLARTHGQPASPTSLGKEIRVFHERLKRQVAALSDAVWAGKFGGATGNFNAHFAAYPEIDWHNFASDFYTIHLGMHRSYPTTQIEHYDHMAALFDNLCRINTILIDYSRDMWQYISMDYFKQEIKEGEIGSSAMPHKVNPIDFENAEGNLGIANALFKHFSAKLPISRLQRDLTDSTVLRNIGVPYGHMLIALKSLLKGANKVALHKAALDRDLKENWMVVAEGIQNILRREGVENPYERLLDLTRKHEKIDEDSFRQFINALEVSDSIKDELYQITPFNYVGK